MNLLPAPPLLSRLRFRFVATLLLASLFAFGLASAATVTVTTSKDVTAKLASPDANFGTDTILQVSGSTTGFAKQTFVQFTVSGIPAGSTGITAQLKLRSQVTGTGRSITVHSVASTSWTEGGVTWNAKPALGTALSTVTSYTNGQDAVWNVSSAVTGNGAFSFGFDGTYTSDTTFSSREGANPPTLVVTYTPPTRDPDAGVYAVWYSNSSATAAAPFLTLPVGWGGMQGGQATAQWAACQPTKTGGTDFTTLENQLSYLPAGCRAVVQVNGGDKPAWLFSEIAYNSHVTDTTIGNDPGAIEYWDPQYITYYTNFISAFGTWARTYNRDHGNVILGVRLNFNAVGTEHTAINPTSERTVIGNPNWVHPANWDGYGANWTSTLLANYQDAVVNAYVAAFQNGTTLPPVRIFQRNNDITSTAVQNYLNTGKMHLFHTSSEDEPRPNIASGGSGNAVDQYQAFKDYCLPPHTPLLTAYAEPWADAYGNHGGNVDDHYPPGPLAWNYFRLLNDLSSGVTFIAIYGDDLQRDTRFTGTRDSGITADAAYDHAFDFANKYAGWQAAPGGSPGAWIALRNGTSMQGDYEFLMARTAGSSAGTAQGHPDTPAVIGSFTGSAGNESANSRFGEWARAASPGGTFKFTLNDAFSSSLSSSCNIRVVFLDNGEPLKLNWSGSSTTVTIATNGSNAWRDVTTAITTTGFTHPTTGDVVLTVPATNTKKMSIHLVEVTR